MGFAPREVNEMSLWEFDCCADGWIAANSPGDEPPLPELSYADFKQIMTH